MGRLVRLCGAILPALSLASSGHSQTQATVYTDGRIFIRRTITYPIARGTTVVPLSLENVLPGSLIALDSGVTITAWRGPLPGDAGVLVRKTIGHRLVFRPQPTQDTTSALVLSLDPPRYQLVDGSVVQSLQGMVLFPGDVVGEGRLASVTVESREARSGLVVGYLASGASWQAHYTLTLSGGRGRLSGAAIIASESLGLDSAEIALLDGPVSRVIPPPTNRAGGIVPLPPLIPPRPSTSPGSPDTIRVYQIPGRHTIRPAEVASLPFLPGTPVEVSRVLNVGGILNDQTQQGRVSGGITPLTVSVRYRVSRVPRLSFNGPLPAGNARIYRPVGAVGMTLIGEAVASESMPAGTLELLAGESVEVVATRTVQEGIPVQDTVVSSSGSRTVRTVATLFEHAVRLQNRTDSALVVEILEQRSAPWTVVASSVPADSVGPGAIRFRIAIPPRGERLFTARMRVPVP